MIEERIYITQRGQKYTQRPYADLSAAERRQILEDYIDLGIKRTCEKWNILDRTLHQLKYHLRPLLEEIEDKRFEEHGL